MDAIDIGCQVEDLESIGHRDFVPASPFCPAQESVPGRAHPRLNFLFFNRLPIILCFSMGGFGEIL
jgi:hypothetical protein